ncbi:MAG: AMP-binding protein, partial [bacterium]|nr:AMP-binding protein [bacterium]
YRIELGEIEAALLTHEHIKDAVVIERKNPSNEKYLCAYIVQKGKVIDRLELKAYLAGDLPGYMIPSFFSILEKMPLLSNGKIDRKALPEPDIGSTKTYIAPRDEVEETLAETWSGVLTVEKGQISIDADFFELGGHSLKATVLISKIHKTLDVNVPLVEIFKRPKIRDLADYIRNAPDGKFAAVKPVEKKEYYPLSSTQKRLYILQQMEKDGTGYNMPMVIPLGGEPGIAKLEETFKKLVARHESLRTSFHLHEDQPVQRIHDNVDFRIPGTREQKPVITAFDLSQAPLMRVGVLKGEEDYFLTVDMHHIISDGISHGILICDFRTLLEGQKLAPLRIQYKDFAEWQNSRKELERIKQQEGFWLRQFEGEIPVLNIPIDYPRPVIQSFEGDVVDSEITGGDTAALKTIALRENATLFMVLMAAYNVTLSRLSGQEDIVIGTPVAGRRHADLDSIIGMFVNTLALRNFPNGEKSFNEFLAEIKERTVNAFENQEYPFEELVERVSVKRDTGRNPLFDVVLALQNIDTPLANPKDAVQTPLGNEYNVAKFDLTLTVVESVDSLFFSMEYCTKLFRAETVQRYVNYFKRTVSFLAANPDAALRKLEILSEEEKEQLLVDFNNTKADFPGDRLLNQLFEEQAEKKPDHIAVSTHSSFNMSYRTYMTYSRLNHKAGQMAYRLQQRGIAPGGIVGIMIERSIEMIIAILGILKAGCAYVPLNPKAPAARNEYMLKETGVGLLLTTGSLYEEDKKIRSWEDKTYFI